MDAGGGGRHITANSEPTTPKDPPLQAQGDGHMTRCNIALQRGLVGQARPGVSCERSLQAFFFHGTVSKMQLIKAVMLAVVTGFRAIMGTALGIV